MVRNDVHGDGEYRVDQLLALCGARRLGGRLDAASQLPLDEEALAWIEGWKRLV